MDDLVLNLATDDVPVRAVSKKGGRWTDRSVVYPISSLFLIFAQGKGQEGREAQGQSPWHKRGQRCSRQPRSIEQSAPDKTLKDGCY
jgi:hypothetical protein